MKKNRAVIVTGGAGFIGSNLVDTLIAKDFQVICIDNESAESNSQFYWNPAAHNIKGNVCHQDSILSDVRWIANEHNLNIETVYHLAAEARIQPSFKKKDLVFRTNVMGTVSMLEVARELKASRFVYSSTSSAYGNASIPFDQYTPTKCSTPYAAGKVGGELACFAYDTTGAEDELQTTVLRYFNVYGPRQPIKGQYAPVVGLFLRQKAEGKPLTVVGDGKQTRDFTHVDDIVAGTIAAGDVSNFIPESIRKNPINLGTMERYSILYLAEMIGGEIVHVPERRNEARHTQADISVAHVWLNYQPTVKLTDWIKEELKKVKK